VLIGRATEIIGISVKKYCCSCAIGRRWALRRRGAIFRSSSENVGKHCFGGTKTLLNVWYHRTSSANSSS